MSIDYDSLKTDAEDLLEEFGAAITLTRPVSDDFDEVTGEETAGDDLTYSGNAVEWEHTSSIVDGELVKSSDLRLLVGGLTVEPEERDRITWKSVAYEVAGCKPVSPGGTVLLYIVTLRV